MPINWLKSSKTTLLVANGVPVLPTLAHVVLNSIHLKRNTTFLKVAIHARDARALKLVDQSKFIFLA